MTYVDDRTPEQKQTHHSLVAATDHYLSGWGNGLPDVSYCAWACKPEDVDTVYRWVEGRGDMRRVRMVRDNWRPSRPRGIFTHTHIYVVTEGHPALGGR